MSIISRESDLPKHISGAAIGLENFSKLPRNKVGASDSTKAKNNINTINKYLKEKNRAELSHNIEKHLRKLANLSI